MIAKRLALAMLLAALATPMNAQASSQFPVISVHAELGLLLLNSKDFPSFLFGLLDTDINTKPLFAKDGEVAGTLIPLPNARLAGCPAKGGAIHPNGKFVYAASDAGSQSHVCAFAFDAATATTTPIPGHPFAAGLGTRALAMERSGQFLYAANLDDNAVAGFAIDQTTGALTAVAGSPFPTGKDPRGIVASPDGRFVYTVNQTPGSVSGFAIDATTGTLTAVPGSPYTTASNPLSLAVEPRGRYLYVSGTTIQGYAIDATSGALTAIGSTASTGGRGIAADPSGRFVFAFTGFATEVVASFAIGSNGTLTPVGAPVSAGANPSGVAVSSSGEFVYATSLIDGTVSGFTVDQASGTLSPIAGFPLAVGENAYSVTIAGGLRVSSQRQAGRYFFAPIRVGGGRPPYTWSMADGALPSGVTLDSGLGALSGVPTAAAVFTFTLRVTDSAGQSATQAFTIDVKGASGPPTAAAIEYHNATLDHYFITYAPNEITKLDAGTEIKGWLRTNKSITVYTAAQPTSSPVCRYYIPPALGDSHFFGRGTVECNETGAKNPSFVLEDAAFMHMGLPVSGVCPANTINVYRVFSHRADANHRYMTDKATRDAMVAQGWLAEGDGPDLVVMCAPS